MRPLRYAFAFSVALLGPTTAFAFTVFKVDPNCVAYGAYDTIQDAVNEAAATAGTDYVWISNGHHTTTYANEHVTINDADGVIIEGGFADCNDSDPGTDTTTINGSGNAVFEITGNSQVYFGNLVVTGGGISGIRFTGQGAVTLGTYTEISHNGAYYGGGISFTALNGDATLSLLGNVAVHDNSASVDGGGVYVVAQNGNATLRLLDSANIHDNTANVDGGGIYIAGGTGSARLLALSPISKIELNHAGNYGGGIDIESAARADLSMSVTDNSVGVYGGVYAAAGGAVAVRPGAVLRMFPHDATHPAGVVNNQAGNFGGGIYTQGDVCLFNPWIDGNNAVGGAAIYQKGGGIYINGGFPNRLGAECGPETVAALGGESQLCSSSYCSLIEANVAATPAYPTGPVIYLAGELIASRLRIEYNVGSYVLETHGASTNLHTCLVTSNSVLALLRADGGTGSTFSSCTFANNTFPGGAHVFEFLNGASGTLNDDIIAEPGHLSVQSSGPLAASHVLSNDISTLPASTNVVAGDPLFVASYDYHLSYKSPAVDFAPAIGGNDLDGAPRDVDLSQVINRFGPADLGAYETQFAFACDPSNDAVFCNGFERP